MLRLLGRSFALAALVSTAAACGESDPSSDDQALTSEWRPKSKHKGNLRFATFNIRNFPVATDQVDSGKKPVQYQLQTDPDRLLKVLGSLNADVIAVQEIWDGDALQKVVDRLENKTYHYQAIFAQNAWSPQHVGLIVNTKRLRIAWSREHPEVDVTKSMRSGLSVRLESVTPGGVDLTVLVLHLASGEADARAALRLQQAKLAAGVAEGEIEELGDDDYIVMGDLNTAKEEEEMPGIDEALSTGPELERHPNETGCSTYFAPNSKKPDLTSAWIDQVYMRGLDEVDSTVPLLSGTHCAVHKCQAFASSDLQTGGTYWSVSDHCPVYFEIKDNDQDATP